jgi:putative ABC transport system permease protein
MLRHLFKLIWNKKKQNFLLIVEMFISFIVMFAVFTMLVYYYNNYRTPVGFEYENVWSVNYNSPGETKSIDSLIMFNDNLKQVMRSMSEIEDVAFCSNNHPFTNNESNTDIDYRNSEVMANIYAAEDSYASVLDMKMVEGRWFSKDDDAYKDRPVIINEALREKLFANQNPIGKVLGSDANKMKIVGVVANFKDKSEFQAPEPGLFRRMDTTEMRWHNSILIKLKAGADAAFESRLHKTLSNAIKNSNIEIEHLSDKKASKNKMALVPMIIFIIVAGFLIINVALGLFGVLWYNINKRRGEIGLRRAVGATGNSISKQLVGEAFVLSTLSLIIGSFFAVQFPLLNVFDLPSGIYITAIILSVIFIYVLVTVCALYPGKQAAAIYPAVALHED